MTELSQVKCHLNPDTMGRNLGLFYEDYPLVHMPVWAVERLCVRWKTRSDVFYVEARSGSGDFLGFIFGHSLGERPWKTLLSDPAWMTPMAAWPVVAKRLARHRQVRTSGENDKNRSLPDLPPFPEGILRSEPYLKAEFMVVRPQFRGMRIAHHLYKGLEDAARNAGLGMLSSRVSVHNVASVSALHRAGWSVYVQSPTTLRTIRKLTDDAVR